jgi:trehalose/maltose hydrolase-like predicted phosphorylase
LLGHEVVGRSQLIKQADVLMMHHMIPDCLPIGSLANDLAYYLPRTCHGSSLSPAVHATVLARAGRADEALRWYRIALAIDLDDLTGTGSGGLHYATFGGVWQALVGGFLGLRPGNNGLEVDPHLPSDWQSVHLAFRFGGAKIEIHADHSEVTVCASEAITFALRCGASTRHTSRLRLRRTDDGWGDT